MFLASGSYTSAWGIVVLLYKEALRMKVIRLTELEIKTQFLRTVDKTYGSFKRDRLVIMTLVT